MCYQLRSRFLVVDGGAGSAYRTVLAVYQPYRRSYGVHVLYVQTCYRDITLPALCAFCFPPPVSSSNDSQPDNLLLFENGTLRICDFGCARRVQITSRDPGAGGQGREEEEEGLTNSVGTYTFHSPESLTGDGASYSGRQADAWAAACTLYCWTFGCLPFHDESLEQLFGKIKTEEVDVGQAVSPELASLLKGMLRKDPTQRIGLQTVLEHPWMQGVSAPPPPAGFDPNA